jgi:ATP-dependent RNA helicase SUPV3L1/SUV3
MDEQVSSDLAPLFAAEAAVQSTPSLRGPLHRLTESLGLIPGSDEETLAHDIRPKLRQLGVRSGRFALFMPALMKPRAALMRMRLWTLDHGVSMPELPNAALVWVSPNQPGWPPGLAAAAGWIEAGPILLRLDIAERIAGDLGYRSRKGPAALPVGLASRMAVKPDLLPAVLRAIGFRVLPASTLAPDQMGPPAPPMLTPLRRPRPGRDRHGRDGRQAELKRPIPSNPVPSGPFAALAALRR